MPTEENPHAGTGSVVLDIGGEIGALIVVMPAEMDGMEIEIIPTGTDSRPADVIGSAIADEHHDHDHPHSHDHAHPHVHSHDHAHTHDHTDASNTGALPPHVAVVGRPTPSGAIVHSLVYEALTEGTYDLYVRPYGPVHLTASVTGGQVTEVFWD